MRAYLYTLFEILYNGFPRRFFVILQSLVTPHKFDFVLYWFFRCFHGFQMEFAAGGGFAVSVYSMPCACGIPFTGHNAGI